MTREEPAATVRVGPELFFRSLDGVPTVEPGTDLTGLIVTALRRSGVDLLDGDVIIVASKIVSRAEGCFVDLADVTPSVAAATLAAEASKDARLVEMILRESRGISRKSDAALIVRHRLGFISANAGIDASNARPGDAPPGSGPWVLTLPRDPDATAERIRGELAARCSAAIGVLITDSWGRPFRRGTVGFAVGAAGIPVLWDRRGAVDRHGRQLEATDCAIADALAAAADLLAGQADESRPITLCRGLRWAPSDDAASALLREPGLDLYA